MGCDWMVDFVSFLFGLGKLVCILAMLRSLLVFRTSHEKLPIFSSNFWECSLETGGS